MFVSLSWGCIATVSVLESWIRLSPQPHFSRLHPVPLQFPFSICKPFGAGTWSHYIQHIMCTDGTVFFMADSQPSSLSSSQKRQECCHQGKMTKPAMGEGRSEKHFSLSLNTEAPTPVIPAKSSGEPCMTSPSPSRATCLQTLPTAHGNNFQRQIRHCLLLTRSHQPILQCGESSLHHPKLDGNPLGCPSCSEFRQLTELLLQGACHPP